MSLAELALVMALNGRDEPEWFRLSEFNGGTFIIDAVVSSTGMPAEQLFLLNDGRQVWILLGPGKTPRVGSEDIRQHCLDLREYPMGLRPRP